LEGFLSCGCMMMATQPCAEIIQLSVSACPSAFAAAGQS
jgi:hypothetical protein